MTELQSAGGVRRRPHIAVVIGGEPVEQVIPPGAFDCVIAADSGLDLAERMGWTVDLVVGDLDSVSPGALRRARDADITVMDYPEDKDSTDFELAMRLAAVFLDDSPAPFISVVGGAGGRLDHLMANLAVLTSDRWLGIEVTAWIGRAWVGVIREHRQIETVAGTEISLLAWHGDADGVTTHGLEWAISMDILQAGWSLGTSNRAVSDQVDISVLEGVLTATIADITLVDPELRVTPSSHPQPNSPEVTPR